MVPAIIGTIATTISGITPLPIYRIVDRSSRDTRGQLQHADVQHSSRTKLSPQLARFTLDRVGVSVDVQFGCTEKSRRPFRSPLSARLTRRRRRNQYRPWLDFCERRKIPDDTSNLQIGRYRTDIRRDAVVRFQEDEGRTRGRNVTSRAATALLYTRSYAGAQNVRPVRETARYPATPTQNFSILASP